MKREEVFFRNCVRSFFSSRFLGLHSLLYSLLLFYSIFSGCSKARKDEKIYEASSIEAVVPEQLTLLKVDSGGRQREIFVWLPRDHVFNRSHSLLFVLHGGGGRAEQVFKTSGVSKHANDFRYVFVFPQGVDNHWADGRGTTDPEKAGVDDVGFIGELIDSFVGVGAVDGARVFSAGISNGGFMTFRLACELSDKVKGIAPIATGFQSRLDGSCQSTSISSVYFIHGDRDRFVPREGGEVRSSAGGSVFSTADTVKKWSKLLGCATLSQAQTKDSISLPADRTSLETSLGEGCAEGKKFKYVNVRNGGHTWPGGGFQPELVVGATTLELNASRSILEYFSH